MNIGNNIKIYRKKLGITQEELAGQLCVTAQAVSKWESGTGLPDTAQIVPLAKMLNVTTDALFGLDEQANDYDRDEASAVTQKANELRDNKDDWVKGAIDAADYLDKQCQNRPYNYGILTRYVQATAHLSRFIDGTYGIKLFEEKEDN